MKKTGYSSFSNIRYALGVYWRERKSLILFAMTGIVMRVALPYTGILLPKIVIDELSAHVVTAQFVTVVGSMAALLILLNFMKSFTDVKINENFGNVGSIVFAQKLAEKTLNMDYELMEDPEAKKKDDKASKAVQSNHTPACNILATVSSLLVNVFGFLLYGGIIVTINPIILLLLILSAVINWMMLSRARRYEKKTREERAKIDRKLGYINDSLTNRDLAKDMRLYTMVRWLISLSNHWVAEKVNAESKVITRNMHAQLMDGLLILLRDSAAYALLVMLLIQDKITLGDFVLLFAAIGAFSGWVSGIIVSISDLFRASSEMSDFRTFLDMPDRTNTGPGTILPPLDKAPGILLENVSYTYPGAEAPTLDHINIAIKAGERIAVVGANGAGKTTLVKLICGLYRTQSGCIRFAGTDLVEFNRDEYFTLFSAVFQDIHLLTTTIAGNVSQQLSEHTDRNKVEHSLRLSGLYDKVMKLPQGMDTLLVREANNSAIELSGGEKQKLALARALYKNAPVILLDEPTAALDPIAESEMYRLYADLTKGRTSIYISHRLASTRFCDRILFIDGHKIVEEGTHDELMRFGGKYASMFALQASYYKTQKGGVVLEQ